MSELNYKTDNNSNPQGKPRVYFTCHPEDFDKTFNKICNDIFKTHDCAVFYAENTDDITSEQENEELLLNMNLFVIPVTAKLLTTRNKAMEIDFRIAIREHIPVLPIIFEDGLDELYSRPDQFGELQYLNPNSTDSTEILYENKLKRYLDSVLISSSTADRIKAAFDAYIFLSYRKKDRQYANKLMRIIHEKPKCRNIAIWFDEFLTPGESFKENIEKILADSKLFALLVTPNLLEEPDGKPNFVMDKEFPAARDAGMEIVPAQMMETDRDRLKEKFAGIPDCLVIDDEESKNRLTDTIARFARKEQSNDPVHNFLIGLAYLNGIDMEIDRARGLCLITEAAESGIPEAMEKLIAMYTDGDGVSKDTQAVLFWSQKLAEYYYTNIFSENKLDNADLLEELFRNYKDPYRTEVIKTFFLIADSKLDKKGMNELLDLIMSYNICDYTIMFDSCQLMKNYKEVAQKVFVSDILIKSVTGIYPPYGPLFWYIPEYELYEILFLVLAQIMNEKYYIKALCLTRDVCFIFRSKTAGEIISKVDACKLYTAVDNWPAGVRKQLCSLFYTGKADFEEKSDIYPRFFNLSEAKSFISVGSGNFTRYTQPFMDELGMYSHNALCELDGEYIGLVSMTYDKRLAEKMLRERPCAKIRGLVFSDGESTRFDYIAFYRKSVRILFIPENTTETDSDFHLHMPIIQGVACNKDGIVYFTDKVVIGNTEKIPDTMFWNNPMLTEVVLPEGVRSLGRGAFLNCENLRKINIPNTVTEIGSYAFDGCKSLSAINIRGNLTQINVCTFCGCTELSEIFIPEGIKVIGEGAFQRCSKIKKISVPHTVEKIGSGAFELCSQLEEINIPEGITTIEPYTFHNTNITEIKLPENIKEIGMRAFYGCTNLRNINIPSQVKRIGSWAFYECRNLSDVTFPYGIEIIEDHAFEWCESFSKIYIPDTVTEIWKSCFRRCNPQKAVLPGRFDTILGDIGLGGDYEVELYGELSPEPDWQQLFNNTAVPEKSCVTEYMTLNIPNGTIQIKDSEFAGLEELKKVHLPESIKKIGEKAFADCRNLEEINIPEGISEIGQEAFLGTFKITKIDIPKSVNKIGKWAFQLCGAEKININADIGEIAEGAFSGCKKIRRIRIPEKVTTIGRMAFSRCDNLEEIYFPSTLSVIGDIAFSGCVELKEFCIPEGGVSVGDGVFKKCKSLVKIQIPSSLKSIGWEAFSGCCNLEEIEIPSTVHQIGNDALDCCEGLKKLRISANFKDDLPRILGDTVPEKVQFI